ncbi:hypothetical protein RRF57_008671 [Xylaria bambusicola]|uniref:Uncharacterized protein n=1 Tax=Xylaria bambusicola TaxID=326684 RepID=A0AAN7Z784_9PEZI
MEARDNNVRESTQADSTGLVAIIVVLVLLVLGSVAVYLLMRWHVAKRRAETNAASAEPGNREFRVPSDVLMPPGEKLHALGVGEERGMRADAGGFGE